jgi:hypothetical protein
VLKTVGLGALSEVEMSKTRRCGAKHISSQKCEKLRSRLDVQTSFCVAGGVDCASTEKSLKHEGFAAFSKTMAGLYYTCFVCCF